MSWLRTAANAPASTANTRNAGVDSPEKISLSMPADVVRPSVRASFSQAAFMIDREGGAASAFVVL